MSTPSSTDSSEFQAMLTNEIKVLASELNAKIRTAAESGLSVDVRIAETVQFETPQAGSAFYPVITTRVLSEVQ